MKFYAKIHSDNESTGRGNNKELTVKIYGWDLGIMVEAFVNQEGDEQFNVNLTDGSNGNKVIFFAKLTKKELNHAKMHGTQALVDLIAAD